MKRTKKLWIFIGSIFFVAALISGFVLMQPSAQDILVNSLENTKSITDGYAKIAFEVDTLDKDASGIVDVWAYRNDDGPGGFRAEILETSDEKYQGAVIVSDGQTLWAYSPLENKVFVGTPEEAKLMIENNEFISKELAEFPNHSDGKSDGGDYQHPETAQEAVQELQEYFNIRISGSETVAGETANQIKMEPIPEEMPAEYAAVGGFINLWIGQDSSTPLAFEFTGSSIGEVSFTVLEYEINNGVDEALFKFEVPEGAELVTFDDLEPQSLTLEEAGESAEFDFLTPANSPPGATLVDILDVGGALVQRYTLPEGGSFTVVQGLINENINQVKPALRESQAVEIRGTTGELMVSDDGSQVLLSWTEGEMYYSVAGDLSTEQVLAIANSLQ